MEISDLPHTWSSDTSTGSLKTIQVTLSAQGGVVREPRYVQYENFSAKMKQNLDLWHLLCTKYLPVYRVTWFSS